MAPNGLMMSYKPGDYDLAVGSGILPNIGRVAVGWDSTSYASAR